MRKLHPFFLMLRKFRLLHSFAHSFSRQKPAFNLQRSRYQSKSVNSQKKWEFPIYVGLGWMALVHLMHMMERGRKTTEEKDGSRGIVATVEGPFHVQRDN